MKKLVMIMMLMPMMALADTEIVDGIPWTYTVSNGKAEIRNGYSSAIPSATTGSIAIPSSLGGYPVTSIGEYAFGDCSGLTSVTIPDGVTSIGRYAFLQCRRLISVAMPSSLTSIGPYAFELCSGLTSVTIPSSVMSIGEYAFGDCSGLTSVTIPSSVTSIGSGAFRGCDGLKSILVDAKNPVYCSVDGILYNKSKTELLQCPGGKTGSVSIPSSVTRIASGALHGTSFYDNLPDGMVILGGGVLYRYKGVCPSSVTIPSSVMSIGESAFEDCQGLTSVTIPSSVTRIENRAFAYCSGLTSVTIPSSVTSIGWRTFYVCQGLTSMTIPPNVTSIGSGAFGACDRLKSILVDAKNPAYCSVDGVLYNRSKTELLQCPAGKSGVMTIPSSVMSIGEDAFYGCGGLTAVTIPLGVASIGELAFFRCSGLKSVTIPEGVTSIGSETFERCSGLTSVTIPSSVTSIGGWAFSGCSGLMTIHVGKAGNIDVVKRMLRESGLDIEGVTFDYVDEPECAYTWEYDAYPDEDLAVLRGCQIGAGASGDIVIPGSLGGCNRIVFGEGSFDVRTDITSVTLSAAVQNSDDAPIGFAFYSGCLNLMKFDVVGSSMSFSAKDGVLYSKDGKHLACCPETFVSFRIPQGVEVIDPAAFAGCIRLTSVTIPSSVTKIGRQAFDGCPSLKMVYVGKDGDIDVVKQMLREIGFNIDGVTFDYGGPNTIVPGEKVEIDTRLDVGYKAIGLPTGLKYDAKTGMITGAATKPTAAEGVVVKFTKSGAETEELTIIVTAIPTVKIAKEGDVDGCKVTGEGAYLVGKKVTLKVTTPKGTAFLGYYKGDEPWPNESDCKKTSLSYEMTRDDVLVVARFEKEKMSVGCTGLEGCFVAGVAGAAAGIPLQIETQSGVKSVKVTKLPVGMKYDSKTGRITGAPTKAENPTVVIEVTAVSGAVERKEIPVHVIAPNEKAVGLFSGFATKDSLRDFNRVGTILLTTTAAGKLTAKVVTKKGSLSFSASSWDGIRDSQDENDGVYFVTMKTKKGEELALELDARADVGVGASQLTGWLKGVDAEVLRIGAQHVVFGQPWYFTATGDETRGWKLSYTADKKAAALTVTFKADGGVTIVGKLGACKVSASGYANVSDLPSELLRADFVVAAKVGKVSRMLNVNTDLRFDRTYAPGEAGEAAFAE